MSFEFSTITINSYSEINTVLAPLFDLNVRTVSSAECVLYTKNSNYGLCVVNSGYVTLYINGQAEQSYSATHTFPWTVRYWKKENKFIFYIDNGNPTYFSLSSFKIKNAETQEIIDTRDLLLYFCQNPKASGYSQCFMIVNENAGWYYRGTGLVYQSGQNAGTFFLYNNQNNNTSAVIILPLMICWTNKTIGETVDLYVPLVWQHSTYGTQEVMTLNNKEYYKFPFDATKGNLFLFDVS